MWMSFDDWLYRFERTDRLRVDNGGGIEVWPWTPPDTRSPHDESERRFAPLSGSRL